MPDGVFRGHNRGAVPNDQHLPRLPLLLSLMLIPGTLRHQPYAPARHRRKLLKILAGGENKKKKGKKKKRTALHCGFSNAARSARTNAGVSSQSGGRSRKARSMQAPLLPVLRFLSYICLRQKVP